MQGCWNALDESVHSFHGQAVEILPGFICKRELADSVLDEWALVQEQRGAPLLFAVLGDGAEHGGATLSFQQRVFQQRVRAWI